MQIFISHAAKDKELASRLAGQLSQAGFDVWNPSEEIMPGDNWAKKIGQALDESDVLVALITPGAFESDALRADVEYGLTSTNFEHRLIPVLVGPTSEVGKGVPWILLKLAPIYVPSRSDWFGEVVERVRTIARQETNAAR